LADWRHHVTTGTQDATGRLTQRSYPTGNPVTFTYDAVGRRTVMVDPDSVTTIPQGGTSRQRWPYDVGNELTLEDAAGGLRARCACALTPPFRSIAAP
jgi:YD repeat-containing protein